MKFGVNGECADGGVTADDDICDTAAWLVSNLVMIRSEPTLGVPLARRFFAVGRPDSDGEP